MSTCQQERERDMANLDRVEESEIKEDDDFDLPELVTSSEDSDLEDAKRPEQDNKPKPPSRRDRPPARPHRELRPRELPSRARPPARPRRELKPLELRLPELPTGKPPPRRRFTKGPVPLPEVTTYRFRPVSPVHPSAAPAAVDHF
jgi:hypothetical protein